MSTITSVWSAYGHRFISDGAGTETCLTCGAVYRLVADPDDPTSGAYLTGSSGVGSTPMECSGGTGMVHGYPGEGYCYEHDSERGCNCLLCNCLLCNCLLCDPRRPAT